MSFWPDGFDPRDPVSVVLQLCNLDTPDGEYGFMLGSDGVFTDVTGKEWVGSTLIGVDSMGFGLDGVSQSATATMAFFEDPQDPSNLVEEIRDLGASYVKGRPATFYVQPLASIEEMYAPRWSPIPVARRIMDHITVNAPDALTRSITLHMENVFKVRGAARRLYYNTEGHQAYLGESNPSLEFVPTEPREERVFGT